MRDNVYRATRTSRGISVSSVAVVLPGGVVITLSGGDLPHVGAVALAEPRPSQKERGKISSTVSILARLGHKEDDLARSLAAEVCESLNVPVVLSAGIHMEGADDDDIRRAVALAKSVVRGSIPELRRLLEGWFSTKIRSRWPS